MDNGIQSTSRWGIKGTEDLGNGLKVGFILENGFAADTGAENEPMFDRESSLFLEGSFGKLAFGRIGSFNQGQGSWSLIGRITPFGTSFGKYSAQAGNAFACATRYDNTIAYQTPSFAGFKVYASTAWAPTAMKMNLRAIATMVLLQRMTMALPASTSQSTLRTIRLLLAQQM